MTTFQCIDSLEENSTEVFLKVTEILIRLLDNVLLYPSDPKYRRLRLENKLVSTIILPSIGAMECLFEIGFQEGDDALILPPEKTSMEKLSKFRSEISNRREKYKKQNVTANNNKTVPSQPERVTERQSTPQPEAAACATTAVATSVNNSSDQFLSGLSSRSEQVLQYQSEATRRKVLSTVPLADINARVQTRMRQHQAQALKDGQPLSEASLQETIFFTELMAWFKNQLFTWVNAPACDGCGAADTQFVEMTSSPTEGERVEVYRCVKCSSRVLFPRINDAARLFDTRRGRCGEWANAFTALCCALGWDARYVLDVTDHVWTEVYFKSEKRWVHLDVCECVIDRPLLYEKGWGKRLSYVIGFSCHDVQDVTWRYTSDHSAVLARRHNCTEQQLVNTIRQLNNLRQSKLSTARRKELARRSIAELVELMVPPKESVGDEQGRQSGSLAWRLARGETSLAQADTPAYVWTPTPQQIESGKMVVSYCCATDQYSDGGPGWRSRVFAVDNVFRKEETDWKTAYLCRTENSTEGQVTWKVDLTGTGLQVDQVEVRCEFTTFSSGKVIWQLCSGDKCLPLNESGELKTSALRGCTSVTLMGSVSGGEGDVAWQHAQLFRQPLDATRPALYLCVTLNKPH